MSSDPKKIGLAVRAAREAAGLSQEELAAKIGCRQATISDIELGKHMPQIPTLQKIAKILDKDMGWFFG